MRIIVVYKDSADYTRSVEEWIHEFEYRTAMEIEKLNPETIEGESFCGPRDILEYPAVAVADSMGKTYELWMGTPLPVIDEVMGYVVL